MTQRTGWVESQGHQLAYVAVNEHLFNDEQPVLVFIHGVLASVNFWAPTLPADIALNRTWYSLSLPAHHPSVVPKNFTAEQVTPEWFFTLFDGALKSLLGQRKAIIIGHSTGGFTALNLAINQAANVIGVISIAGFYSGKWGGVEGALVKLAGLGEWARPAFVANIMLARRSPWLQGIFTRQLAYKRRTFDTNPISQQMLSAIAPNVSQQDPHALFSLFNGIHRLEISHQLKANRTPCYLFVSTHDPVVSAKQSLRLIEEVPLAKKVIFSEVGHMPFMEDTEAYQRALKAAIDDITKQSEKYVGE